MKSIGFYPVQPLKTSFLGILPLLSPAHLGSIPFHGLLNKSIIRNYGRSGEPPIPQNFKEGKKG
jgi:hypothetical protein